jgi:hypothetical protein
MGQQWGGWISQQPFWIRLVAFLATFLVAASPLPLLSHFHLLPGGSTLVIAILYPLLLGYLFLWGRRVRKQSHPFRQLGWQHSSIFYGEMLAGWAIAAIGLVLLFGLEGSIGWLRWQPVTGLAFAKALLNGLALGIAVGIAEELFFRGWLLEELAADYGHWLAFAVSSLIYAATHNWGPQFIGLVGVGLVLALSRRLRRDRLGMPIGLHGGWVLGIALIDILDWVQYTGRVPTWITGIDGNPLAGAMGILFLGLTAGIVACLPLPRQCS